MNVPLALGIWSVDPDGTHAKQLTTGKDDELPVCAPDGTYYYSANADTPFKYLDARFNSRPTARPWR
jgi:hypothetical protein